MKKLIVLLIVFLYSCEDKNPQYTYIGTYKIYYSSVHVKTITIKASEFIDVTSYEGVNYIWVKDKNFTGCYIKTTAPIEQISYYKIKNY